MKPTIVHLTDRPDLLAILADWYASAWAPYYGPEGTGDSEADLQARCQKDEIPTCLIALVGHDELLGSASLTPSSVADRPDLSPWLSALLVPPEFAGQGVDSILVEAIEDAAKSLGQTYLHCDANTDETMKNPDGWEEVSASLLTSRGWTEIGAADSLRGATAIFRKVLVP